MVLHEMYFGWQLHNAGNLHIITPITHHTQWIYRGIGRRPHMYLPNVGRAFGYDCPWDERGCGRFDQTGGQ
jgi:hypothetical protein